jgi:cytoskeletal protein CcmA (bactofilin family)
MQFRKGKTEDEIVSHLGEGTELTGELSFTNGLRVDGCVRGKVKSEALLEVGPSGKVDAEVKVRRILIRGEFRGAIHASDRVEILKDGKVFGDIYSPCLIIEAGALFEGRCNMLDQKSQSKTTEGQSTEHPGSDPGKTSQTAAGS